MCWLNFVSFIYIYIYIYIYSRQFSPKKKRKITPVKYSSSFTNWHSHYNSSFFFFPFSSFKYSQHFAHILDIAMTSLTNDREKYHLTNQIVKKIPTCKREGIKRREKKMVQVYETTLYRLKSKRHWLQSFPIIFFINFFKLIMPQLVILLVFLN